MSLRPQDFKTSIGTARVRDGSVLVYRDRCIGLDPCGCDGWTLVEKDDHIETDSWLGNRVYPPIFDYERSVFVSGDMEQSRALLREVHWIRNEHDRKNR